MKLAYILFSAYVLTLAANPTQEKQKTSEQSTTKITITAVDWNIDTDVPLTCDDVSKSGTLVVITDSVEIKNFEDSLSSAYRSTSFGKQFVDARICCTYWTGNDNKHQIAFERNAMSIDDSVYNLDPKLLDFIVSYIPDYKLVP